MISTKGIIVFMLAMVLLSTADSYGSFISSLPTLPTTVTDSKTVANSNPIGEYFKIICQRIFVLKTLRISGTLVVNHYCGHNWNKHV
jgi:hypothetical protein